MQGELIICCEGNTCQLSWLLGFNNNTLEFITFHLGVPCDIMKSPVWYPSCCQEAFILAQSWFGRPNGSMTPRMTNVFREQETNKPLNQHQGQQGLAVKMILIVAGALSRKRTDREGQQQATYILIPHWKYFRCGISKAIITWPITFCTAVHFPPGLITAA